MPKNNLQNRADEPRIDEMEQELLERLAEREERLANALMDLVRFYQSVGKPQKASAYMEYVLSQSPDLEQRARQYLQKGQLMEQQGNYRMAMAFYAQALPMEPRDRTVWYLINNNLGYCLNYFEEFLRAEEYCRVAIRVDPKRHNAYKNLGISLQGQRRLLDAVAAYVEAIDRLPQDPRALRHLEDLLKGHPSLLIEDPDLGSTVARCQEAVFQAQRQ